MSASDLPYVVGLGIAAGLILGERWLRRRTGQSWWAIDQLESGVFSVVLAILVVYAGHPLLALVAVAAAVWQFSTARRNWVKRSRDLMERNRLELERLDDQRPTPDPFRADEDTFDPRAVPPLAHAGEHPRDGIQDGHGFEFTLSGRPARLLGWVFAKLVRTPEAPDDHAPQ